MLDVLDTYSIDLIMVAVDKAKHIKKYGNPDPPEEICCRLMLERFEYYVGRSRDQTRVIVSDEQKGEEDSIRRVHSSYRKKGTGYTVAKNLIETPFQASRFSRKQKWRPMGSSLGDGPRTVATTIIAWVLGRNESQPR